MVRGHGARIDCIGVQDHLITGQVRVASSLVAKKKSAYTSILSQWSDAAGTGTPTTVNSVASSTPGGGGSGGGGLSVALCSAMVLDSTDARFAPAEYVPACQRSLLAMLVWQGPTAGVSFC